MKIVIFGGTSEGRELSHALAKAGAEVIVSVVSEVGAEEQGAADGVKIEVMRAAVMCYTDHVCPNCRYCVSGAWDDRHVEWVKDEAGEKIPVCPYREEE